MSCRVKSRQNCKIGVSFSKLILKKTQSVDDRKSKITDPRNSRNFRMCFALLELRYNGQTDLH